MVQGIVQALGQGGQSLILSAPRCVGRSPCVVGLVVVRPVGAAGFVQEVLQSRFGSKLLSRLRDSFSVAGHADGVGGDPLGEGDAVEIAEDAGVEQQQPFLLVVREACKSCPDARDALFGESSVSRHGLVHDVFGGTGVERPHQHVVREQLGRLGVGVGPGAQFIVAQSAQ